MLDCKDVKRIRTRVHLFAAPCAIYAGWSMIDKLTVTNTLVVFRKDEVKVTVEWGPPTKAMHSEDFWSVIVPNRPMVYATGPCLAELEYKLVDESIKDTNEAVYLALERKAARLFSA